MENVTYLLSLSSSLILFNLVNSSSSPSVSDPPILTLSLSTVSGSLPGEAFGAEFDRGGYGSYTSLLHNKNKTAIKQIVNPKIVFILTLICNHEKKWNVVRL